MRKTFATAVTLSLLLALTPQPDARADWGSLLEGAGTAVQGFTLTEADEVAIGEQTTASILKETPALANQEVQTYVQTVGKRLVAQVGKTPYTFTFTVIDSDEVNAFAAPGGFVFVTTGALALMNSEAQLAGVLGHEIGHVTKRHGVDSIKKAMLAQGALTALAGQHKDKTIAMASSVAANLVLKGYGRAAENESDTTGAGLAARAGYDPKGIEEFLTALAREAGDNPIWLMPVSSHPRSDDRVALLAASRPATGAKPFVGKEGYKKHVLDVLARM